jgi:hypothetical protein
MAFICRHDENNDVDSLDLQFKEREMNDVLKSLIIEDRGEGRVAGLSYQTAEDIDKQISEKALIISNEGSILDMLRSITGSRVELTLGDGGDGDKVKIFGRVVGIQCRPQGPLDIPREQVLLLLESGEIRFIDLNMVEGARLADLSAYSDIQFFLDATVSKRKKSMKAVTLFLEGKDHELDISYISQMAPWRMSYRLFHTPKESKLQSWGIVDNTLDEDLKDINLTLISGKPISFIYDLYLAQTVKRQRIKEEQQITMAPVELEGEKRKLEKGELELEEMREQAKDMMTVAAQPVPKPSAMPPSEKGLAAGAGIDALMSMAMECKEAAAPMKMKRARAPAERRGMEMKMAKKMDSRSNYELDAICEEEAWEEAEEECYDDDIGGLISDFEESLETGYIEEREPTAVEDYGEGAESTVISTEAVKLPEFFRYEITTPVTIRRGQSAMVPILQKTVTCTREMIYNRIKTGKHPLIVMRIENELGLRLERGPITILHESEYVGEGILPALDPGAEARVAYAIATGVRVREDNKARTTFREIEIKGDSGIYRENHDETFKYVIENDSLDTIGVVIEHPRSKSHKLYEMEDPFEVSEDLYRWKVTVHPKREVSFKVVQREIVEEKFGLLTRTLSYVQYKKEEKISETQFDRLKKVHDMNSRINRYGNNHSTLQSQESNMINYLRSLNDLAGSLSYEPGHMNLKNRLMDKYLEVEYRLAKLRGVILDIRSDLRYLRSALNHLYWPERTPDFKHRELDEISMLSKLLREQTLQYWYNQSSRAVGASCNVE